MEKIVWGIEGRNHSTLTRRFAAPSPSGRGNDLKVVPLPLGVGAAKRRVRVEWFRPSIILALFLASCTSTSAPAPDPMSDDAQNIRLVGYNDLQGRTALQVTTKSDPANGNWVYVGHHESFRDGKPLLNPI